MAVALYMNVHVPKAITVGLRLRSVDVLTAQEDGAVTVIVARLSPFELASGLEESSMSKEYVEKVEGGAYRIAGTRVSLDSIVYGFWNGESPETIAQSFPTLKLEQVYGAIAFYLANQEEIDEYIKQGEVEYEAKRKAAREADPMFYQKMAEARRKMQTQVR